MGRTAGGLTAYWHLVLRFFSTPMTKYEFTLVLKDPVELSEEVADKLFEAGCADGTPGTCNGVFSVDFHRKATSLEEAIRSAAANVKAAGYELERVEIDAQAVCAP